MQVLYRHRAYRPHRATHRSREAGVTTFYTDHADTTRITRMSGQPTKRMRSDHRINTYPLLDQPSTGARSGRLKPGTATQLPPWSQADGKRTLKNRVLTVHHAHQSGHRLQDWRRFPARCSNSDYFTSDRIDLRWPSCQYVMQHRRAVRTMVRESIVRSLPLPARDRPARRTCRRFRLGPARRFARRHPQATGHRG